MIDQAKETFSRVAKAFKTPAPPPAAPEPTIPAGDKLRVYFRGVETDGGTDWRYSVYDIYNRAGARICEIRRLICTHGLHFCPRCPGVSQEWEIHPEPTSTAGLGELAEISTITRNRVIEHLCENSVGRGLR